MVERTFVIEPRYLPYAEGTSYHQFQLDMLSVAEQAEDCLIVEAPTGAGKTHVLCELSKRARGQFAPRLLITSPTNALASQICNDLRRTVRELRVRRWAADEFSSNRFERNLELITQAQTEEVIVSNPDLLHLFVQNFYAWRLGPNARIRSRTFDDAMARFGVHVFDEYHVYDERMMASVVSYMIKAKALPVCAHHRYVFLSATPNRYLPEILEEFSFTYRIVREAETSVPPKHGRAIKKKMDVTVTIGDVSEILSLLPSPSSSAPRSLVVFDSFARHEQTLQALLNSGYDLSPTGNIVAMTGRDTKSINGQKPWDEAAIIMATSKADLGLNIDNLELLIMEPGWFDTQFHQRFGRAGRSKESRVVIVLPRENEKVYEKLLNMNVTNDLSGLNQIMSKVTTTRPFSNKGVARYVGYQMASTEYLMNKPGMSDRLREITLPQSASHARQNLRKAIDLVKDFEDDLHPHLQNLIDRIVKSFCLLRGQSLEVECVYPRGARELSTKDNLCYILSRTYFEERQHNSHKTYVITGFRDELADVCISYPGVPNSILVPVPRGTISRKTWESYTSRLIEDLTKKTKYGQTTPSLDALRLVLQTLDPDTVAPLEVTADDMFV